MKHIPEASVSYFAYTVELRPRFNCFMYAGEFKLRIRILHKTTSRICFILTSWLLHAVESIMISQSRDISSRRTSFQSLYSDCKGLLYWSHYSPQCAQRLGMMRWVCHWEIISTLGISLFNPCRAEFIWGSMKIYLHFRSLNTETFQGAWYPTLWKIRIRLSCIPW